MSGFVCFEIHSMNSKAAGILKRDLVLRILLSYKTIFELLAVNLEILNTDDLVLRPKRF